MKRHWPYALGAGFVLVTAPFVGIAFAVLSAVGAAILIGAPLLAIDVIRIWRHPLDGLSPTNQELDRWR